MYSELPSNILIVLNKGDEHEGIQNITSFESVR